MYLPICILSSLFHICSAQQSVADVMTRIFHNPFRVRIVPRVPGPPPSFSRRAQSPSPVSRRVPPPVSPCPGGCDEGYVCYGGGCQRKGSSLCNPICKESQTCHHGHCHFEPCRPACGNGQRCINGKCEDKPCEPRCRNGEICNKGICEKVGGTQCSPLCPPGYVCHCDSRGDCHCDSLNARPHQTCDRPCPPNSRCIDGHCTGEALTVGAVTPNEVRPVNPVQTIPNVLFPQTGSISPLVPNSETASIIPVVPNNRPISPIIRNTQNGPFSSIIPNSQTNTRTSIDPNSRWNVRDSSGSRVPWARPPPIIIRPGSSSDISPFPGSSGPIDLNPISDTDLFPMTDNVPAAVPQSQSRGVFGTSALSGTSESGTGMSLPPLSDLLPGGGVPPIQNRPAQPAVPQQPIPPGPVADVIRIPDIAEVCQGNNCVGAPLSPGSNVGLNPRPVVPQNTAGRGDNCGQLTCFENEFCFDAVTSTCMGVNTGDARIP
ncbi:uncharacterized protein LOC133173875 [Saccostrea echinata]|uniref:uncharacterized protein LOC133173875 n=1 Tax=Saccostrea echinata TaxID=191078 RepID=UPI002A8249AC|nr:uncharacterized protein LOC133173875 [Saccostrea echinata]